MPKATKLHAKGKSHSIQKLCVVEKDSTANTDPDDTMRQYQLELCWCVQQLERSLCEKKGNDKQMQEAWKVLTVLKNNNQPIIRKRQLMRTHFGDYRAKMAAEEKKLAKMASKIKITEAPDKPKATFLRKSAFLTTGNSSFRFNFDLAPEQTDNGSDANTDKNILLDSKDTKQATSDTKQKSDDASAIGANVDRSCNSTEFKFSFSGSEFKFNFDVEK